MNAIRTISVVSRCYISRRSKLCASIFNARSENKIKGTRSRDLMTNLQPRQYSTEFNRHFVKMKRMKEEGYVPSEEEKTLEWLNIQALQAKTPNELIENRPDYLPTLLRLFESEKTMVRNTALKIFASMPDIPEWLNFLNTDSSLQSHLPVILANFYSFATHPERPYARQKATTLHKLSISAIQKHYGKTHPLAISVLYRIGILYSLEENTIESINYLGQATKMIEEFVQSTSDPYHDDIGLVMQHSTIYYEYLEALKKRKDLNVQNASEIVSAGKTAMDLCNRTLEMIEKSEDLHNNQKIMQLKELALKMKESFSAVK